LGGGPEVGSELVAGLRRPVRGTGEAVAPVVVAPIRNLRNLRNRLRRRAATRLFNAAGRRQFEASIPAAT
jgi:hypothetical protein